MQKSFLLKVVFIVADDILSKKTQLLKIQRMTDSGKLVLKGYNYNTTPSPKV